MLSEMAEAAEKVITVHMNQGATNKHKFTNSANLQVHGTETYRSITTIPKKNQKIGSTSKIKLKHPKVRKIEWEKGVKWKINKNGQGGGIRHPLTPTDDRPLPKPPIRL